MIGEGESWIEKDLEVSSHDQIEVLSQHLPWGTEEDHRKTHSGKLVSQPRFKSKTLRMQIRSVTATPACFTEYMLS